MRVPALCFWRERVATQEAGAQHAVKTDERKWPPSRLLFPKGPACLRGSAAAPPLAPYFAVPGAVGQGKEARAVSWRNCRPWGQGWFLPASQRRRAAKRHAWNDDGESHPLERVARILEPLRRRGVYAVQQSIRVGVVLLPDTPECNLTKPGERMLAESGNLHNLTGRKEGIRNSILARWWLFWVSVRNSPGPQGPRRRASSQTPRRVLY